MVRPLAESKARLPEQDAAVTLELCAALRRADRGIRCGFCCSGGKGARPR